MSRQALVKRALTALKQGGTLSIRSRVPQTSIKIIPSWREDGALTVDSSDVQLGIQQKDDKMTSLGRSEAHIMVDVDPGEDDSGSVSIEAHVPEKVNLSCHLEEGGTVEIEKKIEGDVDVTTSNGDILLNKVRGYQISLQATEGTIYSSDLLEAQHLNIRTSPGRLRAKRIHGTDVNVEVHQTSEGSELMDEDDEGAAIDISSLYISGSGDASLVATTQDSSNKAIRCKSHHGHVNAESDGVVELGGVNGSFDVNSGKESHIHVDSLALDSISVVSSQSRIGLTMDRKLQSDLRLVTGFGTQEMARSLLLEDDETVIQQGLQQHDDDGDSQTASEAISVITSAFTEEPLPDQDSFQHLQYKQGYIDNKSMEPDSRFEQGAGKIRFEGAAQQALDGFSSSGAAERPLIVGACESGRISVESLSWLGAIARRYGLEEGQRSNLGRQATRRGRDLGPTD